MVIRRRLQVVAKAIWVGRIPEDHESLSAILWRWQIFEAYLLHSLSQNGGSWSILITSGKLLVLFFSSTRHAKSFFHTEFSQSEICRSFCVWASRDIAVKKGKKWYIEVPSQHRLSAHNSLKSQILNRLMKDDYNKMISKQVEWGFGDQNSFKIWLLDNMKHSIWNKHLRLG